MIQLLFSIFDRCYVHDDEIISTWCKRVFMSALVSICNEDILLRHIVELIIFLS